VLGAGVRTSYSSSFSPSLFFLLLFLFLAFLFLYIAELSSFLFFSFPVQTAGDPQQKHEHLDEILKKKILFFFLLLLKKRTTTKILTWKIKKKKKTFSAFEIFKKFCGANVGDPGPAPK
jgi:hypothetical protein